MRIMAVAFLNFLDIDLHTWLSGAGQDVKGQLQACGSFFRNTA
jgi:hypothetical protein